MRAVKTTLQTTLPAVGGVYKNGSFEPMIKLPKLKQPKRAILIFLEDIATVPQERLMPATPPIKNKKLILKEFKKTGKYSHAFLKSLEKGLARSSYFTD